MIAARIGGLKDRAIIFQHMLPLAQLPDRSHDASCSGMIRGRDVAELPGPCCACRPSWGTMLQSAYIMPSTRIRG